MPDTTPVAPLPLEQRSLLTREDILGADDLRYELVPVPEWRKNAVVRVRSLQSVDRDRFEVIALTDDTSHENIRAKLLAFCLVDADGTPLFSEADIAALGKKSAVAMSRLYGVASRLNRITEADIDELAKNSDGGASATSA